MPRASPDIPDTGVSRRPADRGELRGATSSDGDGGANLERGSGLLWPRLDTAPFPNFFVVELPLYECGVIALKRSTGMSLGEAGRVLSALTTVLAAGGLFALALPREGRRAALLAVLAFAVFPVTIRYGRAFQPDAAMLGAVVAGLACWDRYQSSRRWYWLATGWSLLALGFALKVIAAFLLIPLLFVILRRRRPADVLGAVRRCCRPCFGMSGLITWLGGQTVPEPRPTTGPSGFTFLVRPGY